MAPTDPVTLIVPIHNSGERTEPALRAWSEFLQKELGREYDILLVDDGSAQPTAQILDELAKSLPKTRLLRHEQHQGFGASLRTALAQPTHPIVAYTALDYPYTPSDLSKLLGKLDEQINVLGTMRTVEAVSGCRTGQPMPAFWRLASRLYRIFWRIVLGVVPHRAAGWLGVRDHLRAWIVWSTMGVPLEDVNSAMKVFRRSRLDQFPIQSDSDFVHAEIFAKLTHLITLMNEVPLTPIPDATPRTWWNDYWRVFQDAKFHTPLVGAPGTGVRDQESADSQPKTEPVASGQ